MSASDPFNHIINIPHYILQNPRYHTFSYLYISSSQFCTPLTVAVRRLKLLQPIGYQDGDVQVQTVQNYVPLSGLAVDIFSNQHSYKLLHLFAYFREVVLMNAPEDPREHQGVVDLIFKITPSATIDKCPSFQCVIQSYFRIWIRQRQNNWFLTHRFYHLLLQDSWSRNTDENISTFDDFCNSTLQFVRICYFGQLYLLLIHALSSSFKYCTFCVHHNDVFDPVLHTKLAYGDSCRPNTRYYHFQLIKSFLNKFQSIDQSSQSNYSSAMLIIMENWQNPSRLQTSFNEETLWSLNILQIYCFEIGPDIQDSLHSLLISFPFVQTDRYHVDATKNLKQQGFSFHDRKASFGPNISQTQNRSSISHNCAHMLVA